MTTQASAVLKGIYYPAGSSRAEPAEIMVDTYGLIHPAVSSKHLGIPRCGMTEMKISTRVGSTPRQLRFPDGSLFETEDNDAVDQVLPPGGSGWFEGVIHKLESKARHVLISAAVIFGFIYLFMVYVVPDASRRVAMSLPPSVAVSVGEGTLDLLDDFAFDPSRLSAERKAELRQQLQELAAASGSEFTYRLEFRSSPEIGANAFALPDGTLVLMDGLEELAENDQQIMAVMSHEIGHVVHRHGLRQALQRSGLSVMLILVTGDIVSATNLAAAIPAFLLESHYSREMETEADDYALQHMQKVGLEPVHFANIMRLLAASHGQDDEDGMPGFLSTHPMMEERIERFEP
ncbi:M48 family metallopeptidase [Parendozoicomonas haliclonae]|uniref:Metalloprotease LoiP n=1 Tax=Parendozoicomonas haliclonae TaxID=1960125 RepID=A0A1X7AIA7_9GAMM|nr:M48 family metallopeptidase [Parendozoicomonas haliclonae]SMA38492.1 Metalloprotease LoiP precursor [Parendozoicomonas haliclonae]